MPYELLPEETNPSTGKYQLLDDAPSAGVGENIKNMLYGAGKGASRIGNTILMPIDAAARALGIENSFIGRKDRSEKIDQFMAENVNPNSIAYKTGDIGTQIAGTLGVGGALGNAVKTVAPSATALANALRTSGMKAGDTTGLANILTRIVGGAGTGAASAGLVDPDSAGTGAVVGAALPPVMMGMGKTANAVGRVLSGPEVPQSVQEGVQAARELGYVIPPSQAKPTLANRALEGFAGKITTAQNASARNQEVTNKLAKQAIGADELSEAGLTNVRRQANQSYDALGKAGAFKSDQAFKSALDEAGETTEALRKNFPVLVNNDLDSLINGLKASTEFEAQPTIEAIKRFRADAYVNKISTDPAKRQLGKAQNKISNALEDLIDRNLQEKGESSLLENYRKARQTLSKTHEVEKALNATSGNIDASKLAAALKKGRPLTDELRQVAEFSAQFPKATQTIEKMGSLPQVSPLDIASLGTMSAVTSNPLLMAGVLARPAARSLVLSNPVQNNLVQNSRQKILADLLANPSAAQMLYRASPVLGSSQ